MPSADNSISRTTRMSTGVVYLSAFLQGLVMVSFAASATVLKDAKDFTDAQYGLIFLPQIITTIIGSLAGGSLAQKVGLSRILLAALIAIGLSQVGLAIAVMFFEQPVSFYLVMGSTAMFGVAFGLGAAPLNTYPGLIFPNNVDTALVALHSLTAAGMATGPLLLAPLTTAGMWPAYPLFLIIVSVILSLLVLRTPLPVYRLAVAIGPKKSQTKPTHPLSLPVMWIFISIAVLYAFVEGTFANWTIIFLNEERSIDLEHASFALAIFWAMLAAGRLLVSVLLLKMNAAWIWLTLPLLMVITLWLLPLTETAAGGVVLFALAGLSCSAFFPLTMGLASKRFADNKALVSSLLIAAIMAGIGLGSYIIGPLRQAYTISEIYRFSIIYPLGALVLAIGVVLASFSSADLKARACKLIFGHDCLPREHRRKHETTS